jgi:hypothetical protein
VSIGPDRRDRGARFVPASASSASDKTPIRSSGPSSVANRERRGFDGLRDGVAAGYSKQAGATAPEHPAVQGRGNDDLVQPQNADADVCHIRQNGG